MIDPDNIFLERSWQRFYVFTGLRTNFSISRVCSRIYIGRPSAPLYSCNNHWFRWRKWSKKSQSFFFSCFKMSLPWVCDWIKGCKWNMCWLKFVILSLVLPFFSYISLNTQITLAFFIEFWAAQQWLWSVQRFSQ